MNQQVPEHAGTKDERRHDPPAAIHVQRHPWAGDTNADAVKTGVGSGRPLAEREVGDLMTGGDESPSKVGVSSLGSAYGVRVQAVV
jgi:hypothetical protein